MKVTALEVTDTTAIVELRPCWLARWFGARTVRVELVRVGKDCATYATQAVLRLGSDRELAILEALDFRPVAAPPTAKVVRR